MVNRDLALHSALRTDDGVEVGILGGDIGRTARRLAVRALREWGPARLQEVILVAERRRQNGRRA